jgi:hypothetical protein
VQKLLLNDVAGLLAAACLAANAQEVQHLSITVPGGMPGLPVVTGVALVPGGVSITWDGPSGYYQLFENAGLAKSNWLAVGKDTNLTRHATVKAPLPSELFRVSGPAPQYAGSQICSECHSPVVNTVAHTAHAGAFTDPKFVADKGQSNAACLSCHTVGYDVPTGFSSAARTPSLAGVQCENCHGPAANHAANPDDPTSVPRVEVAATMCGGCHANRYAEWKTSDHTQVISNLNAATQIGNCGRCHSGTARLSLIAGQTPLTGDASLGIECITCHDPHQTTGAYPAQLRYPLASTNDYFMPTNGAFATYYNPKINVCGQCHNHAGASWTNSAGPPHPSSQYNMLLGTIGAPETSGLPSYQPGSHALLLTNQCVECHMQTTPFVSQAAPGDAGHSFKVDRYDVCLQCHPYPKPLAQFVQGSISNQVQQLKFDLDYWAANKAPAALFRKYGNLSWEYTTPGQLSSGGPGPDAAEQALIPDTIKKARFNVYVILSDQSLGVHNPYYCVTLLDNAEDWIVEALAP